MTEAPEFFADRPDHSPAALTDGAQPHDVLSELLRMVRLRGERIFCCTPRSPFAILFDHRGGTLHIVQQGEVELDLGGERSNRRYRRGDAVMLPAAQRHTLRRGRGVPPRPPASGDLRHDTAPSAGTRWLSGTFAYDDSRAVQLLSGLPPVIELRGAGDQSLVWLDVSSQMLVRETTSPSQGSAVMVSRILDLLFIQVLRAWAAGPDAEPGWLTAAMDPVIGEAITQIHANPRHPWTVKTLARKSNLSRSAFAERFARRAGQPPATYITELRLASAADLLLDTTEPPISAIASDVGYESEAAFSRAFSRRYGMPPSRWRREGQRR
jgi:AraC-like DNA-binding protein